MFLLPISKFPEFFFPLNTPMGKRESACIRSSLVFGLIRYLMCKFVHGKPNRKYAKQELSVKSLTRVLFHNFHSFFVLYLHCQYRISRRSCLVNFSL